MQPLPSPELFSLWKKLAGGLPVRMSLQAAEDYIGVTKLKKMFCSFLPKFWGQELWNKVFPDRTVAELESELQITLYNGVRWYYNAFHAPHERMHAIMRCWISGSFTKRGKGCHAIWVQNLAAYKSDEDSFNRLQVCFPYLYFGFTAPDSAVQFLEFDPDGSKLNLRKKTITQKRTGLRVEKLIPQPIGFAFIRGSEFTNPSLLPDKIHDLVSIK